MGRQVSVSFSISNILMQETELTDSYKFKKLILNFSNRRAVFLDNCLFHNFCVVGEFISSIFSNFKGDQKGSNNVHVFVPQILQ